MQKPTIPALVQRLEQLESAVTGTRQRERLTIPDVVDVWLAPGVTVDAIFALLEQIYGLPWHEREGSHAAIDAGRPDVTRTPTGPAGPGGTEQRKMTAGQRAIQRVEREQRQRRLQSKRLR